MQGLLHEAGQAGSSDRSVLRQGLGVWRLSSRLNFVLLSLLFHLVLMGHVDADGQKEDYPSTPHAPSDQSGLLRVVTEPQKEPAGNDRQVDEDGPPMIIDGM